MQSTCRTILGAVVLVGATSLITTQVVSQDGDDMMGMDPEMMAKWMEYMTPSAEHQRMQEMVGKWDMQTKMWYAPGMEAIEGQSTAQMRSVMGGRYIVEHVKGEPNPEMGMPMPFEGMNILGYDNLKKKHFFAWIDNMGTGLMYGEGEANADGSVVTYFAEGPDPMTGQMKRTKFVSRHVNDDKSIGEMYDVSPEGDWWKTFEIVYTRQN